MRLTQLRFQKSETNSGFAAWELCPIAETAGVWLLLRWNREGENRKASRMDWRRYKKWWRDPVLPGILFHVQNQTAPPFFTLKNVGFGSLRHTKNNLRQTAKNGNRAAIMVINGNTRTAFNARSIGGQYTPSSLSLQAPVVFVAAKRPNQSEGDVRTE